MSYPGNEVEPVIVIDWQISTYKKVTSLNIKIVIIFGAAHGEIKIYTNIKIVIKSVATA